MGRSFDSRDDVRVESLEMVHLPRLHIDQRELVGGGQEGAQRAPRASAQGEQHAASRGVRRRGPSPGDAGTFRRVQTVC